MTESKISITVEGAEKSVEKGCTALSLIENMDENQRALDPILGATINGVLRELAFVIEEPCSVEWVRLSNDDGNRMYTRSLTFMLLLAMRRLYPDETIEFKHSLGGGLYIENESQALTAAKCAALEQEMRRIVEDDMPLVRERVSLKQAQQVFEASGAEETAHLLNYRPYDYFILYQLGDLKNYFYGYMAPSTGFIRRFKLHYHMPGAVLLYPLAKAVDQPLQYVHHAKLFGVFYQAAQWGQILSCRHVADLNEAAHRGQLPMLVRLNEALHEKEISRIADSVCADKKRRVILVAGPSSSGKTTFAQRLAIQLRVNGVKPVSISLDNYYLNRDDIPVDENGKRDFENIKTLDVPLFNENLTQLLNGEETELPLFNFHTGMREWKNYRMSIDADQPVIIEGIHGLNDQLTPIIPREMKYKIYISALTHLNLDTNNRIPTTDARLLRRLVRDYKSRSTQALDTLAIWPLVRRGEDLYIFPYQEEADWVFNSSLVYELSIIKKYAYTLLHRIPEDSKYYNEARRMIKFLNYFVSVDDEREIPLNSILREFIGGGIYT